MFLSDFSIKRPVLIAMLMTALLLFGVLSYRDIPLNLMPDAKVPFVTITTVYPGASPEQIEKQITRLVEDELAAISGLKSMESYSMNSASLVMLEFNLDKNPDIASQEVKEKVDLLISTLPDDAEAPLVTKVDITAMPVMNLVLSGDIEPTELNRLAETTIKENLSRLKGVGSVDIIGGQEKEVRVSFSSTAVYENSISLLQAAGVLAQANIDMPGGSFINESEEYSVSLRGQISSSEELEEIMIPTAAGMRKLDQLAEIEAVPQDVKQRISYFNNSIETESHSVLVSVIKSPDGNPVELAEAIRTELPGLRNSLPESVSLNITMDDSIIIRDTVTDTLGNIILGIVFTAAILLFFLHDLRSTLIVGLTMPLSIIPSFIVLDAMGISINMMSLMGLSTSVGVLVMNSVVVLENIFRHKGMGHSRIKAASGGTAEVTVSVLASTLTNICVFLPIGTMGGMVGLFLRDFALTVVTATLFSLLISFTLTPMLASRILPESNGKKGRISAGIEGFFKSLEQGYRKLLESILHSRIRSALLILFTLVLFAGALAGLKTIPFEFVPAMDKGEIRIETELPTDASIDQTAAVMEEIESRLRRIPEVESIVTQQGRLSSIEEGSNLALTDIRLIRKSERAGSRIIASRIGADLADIPNARIRVYAVSGMVDNMGMPVDFYLKGNDISELHSAAAELHLQMEQIHGLTGISSSMKPGRPELILIPDRRKLAEMGITVSDLSMNMRAAVEGLVLSRVKGSDKEYDIRVSLRDEDVASYEQIKNIAIPTLSGLYPLSTFAEVEMEEGVNQILRSDKMLSVRFTADVLPGTALSDVTSLIEEKASLAAPGIKLGWGGSAEMMNETVSSMAFAFILAIVLTYMLLAATLEKLGQPLLILSTIPLSLIGVAALFLIYGFPMNMVSMLSVIMLVGMVVNNAILILEYTNQKRSQGLNIRDALLEACPAKLQPILMANTATMLGMLPMALGLGESGAEMRQPMGLVSIGGLLAATFLSLLVIPALENLIESGIHKRKTKKELIEA